MVRELISDGLADVRDLRDRHAFEAWACSLALSAERFSAPYGDRFDRTRSGRRRTLWLPSSGKGKALAR